jgi:DNA-binding Lrp family transcriptional regulator
MAKVAAEEIERRILVELPKATRRGFFIEELAERTGLKRQTVSKYVWGLHKSGKLKREELAGGKIVFVSPIEGDED